MHVSDDHQSLHRRRRPKSLQAVRFYHPSESSSTMLTGRLVYDSDTEQSTLQCTAKGQSLRGSSNFAVQLPYNVMPYDFCFTADQVVFAIAVPIMIPLPSTILASDVQTGPCRAYLDSSSSTVQAEEVDVEGFSNSHALCVEPAAGDAHAYWFGHKDGSLTLWDDRSNQVAMCTASGSDSATFGGVLSVTALSTGRVLARFGCGSNRLSSTSASSCVCRLYDARQSKQALQEYAYHHRPTRTISAQEHATG
jgi:hypothetical protein